MDQNEDIMATTESSDPLNLRLRSFVPPFDNNEIYEF